MSRPSRVSQPSTPRLLALCAGGLALVGASSAKADALRPATLALGVFHSCVLLEGGLARCFGDDGKGQLGDGAPPGVRTTLTILRAPSRVIAIAAGSGQTCAILDDTTVWCSGRGVIAGLSSAIAISGSADSTCVVLADGTARCWGLNAGGELGDGTMTARDSPTMVSTLVEATSIAVGFNHACAVLSDTQVRCWGTNDKGELGDGTTTTRLSPTLVADLSGVAQVVTGGQHTCARLLDGTVRCWGYDYDGELGDGSDADQAKPTEVPGLSDVVTLAASLNHTCALLADGTVRCWGSTQFLASDGRVALRSPTIVSGLGAVSAIGVGAYHACARLRDDASVWCWGDDTRGQLGDGALGSREEPRAIIGWCAGDGSSLIGGAPASCAPYRCEADACLTRCASASQCVADRTCNAEAQCVVSPPPPAPSGGCRVGSAASGLQPVLGGATATMALALARRRRRR
jgi:alpha-tubulin suppressor-like RCC1 family protein